MLAGEIQTDHDLHHEAMASLMLQYDEATCDAVFIVGHSTEAGSVSRADVDARGVPRTASAAPTSSKPPTVTADFGPRSVRRDSVPLSSDSFEEGGRVTDKRGAARRVGGLTALHLMPCALIWQLTKALQQRSGSSKDTKHCSLPNPHFSAKLCLSHAR